MSRSPAYFKHVAPTIGLDASQNQMLNTLVGTIYTLQAEITAEQTRAEEVELAKVNKSDLEGFITAFGSSIYLSNAGGTGEFDYTAVAPGFVPVAGVTGTSTLVGAPVNLGATGGGITGPTGASGA